SRYLIHAIDHPYTHYFPTRRSSDLLKNKPSITYTLIILNIVMYIVMTLFGGTENIANLVRFGAKYSPYIINGQNWRLITPMFIQDRKSTRLNSSHVSISYAVFCLKK